MKMLIPHETIYNRVREMAHIINNDYLEESITVVCVLKGAVMFFSDLVRHIKSPVKYEFVSVSTYGDEETPQAEPIVNLMGITPENINDQNVLIIEDVIDTGNTLKAVAEQLCDFSPKTLRACVLVDKTKDGIAFDESPMESFRVYLGFRVDPDVFIIGYGMDNKGFMRNQADITTKRESSEHVAAEKLNGGFRQLGRV